MNKEVSICNQLTLVAFILIFTFFIPPNSYAQDEKSSLELSRDTAGTIYGDDFRAAFTSAFVDASPVPQHPFLAPNGKSNVHNDAYMSDTYRTAGPQSAPATVLKTSMRGECATVTIDALGRIVTVCISPTGSRRLQLLDSVTLNTLATYNLPRGISFAFVGGAYFYLDNLNRVIVPTIDQKIQAIAINVSDFSLVWNHDLRDPSKGPAVTEQDGSVVSVIPDWNGRIWFVTENAVIGYVVPTTGQRFLIRVPGEKVGNSLAVDETGGVFVVTDHALYRFDVGDNGPLVTWRESYDRGNRLKPGQANFGSGTTPTLLGTKFVAITDNSDPYMHVLVFRREAQYTGTRQICNQPVFDAYLGATDNSLIGAQNSFIVENNYGYTGPASVALGRTTTPGVARIDLMSDEKSCFLAWSVNETAPSVVPKLSLESGLVYLYTKESNNWFLTAISYQDGQRQFKKLVGSDSTFNNHWAPITIIPDGAIYIGLINGLVRLK